MAIDVYGCWPSADTALRVVMEVINISSHLKCVFVYLNDSFGDAKTEAKAFHPFFPIAC